MTTRPPRRPGSRRPGPAAVPLAFAGVLLCALAGCASDDGADDEVAGVATATADASGDDETAAHTAALTDLYQRYWDARVAVENSGELDPAGFDGILAPDVTEQELTRVRSFADAGLHREGEPLVADVTVTVDGDTARLESCVSERDWPVVHGDEVLPDVVPEELRAPHPHALTATLTQGAWLIDGSLPMEEATISCS
ncbi:hypothetical protein RM844_24795 [Streptomyces sp. DSM 44915]|uniref:Lipoprotein n=1 Tax=Streptomyces chisholmiae TaxID=3075540 RepID=A0ABU2JX08_9ACTN|nr:hypothetical protein [Streptomyces sp. DSM 44915]MDT0269504.1 hypothetical protein [Streptomyces sp. DSM 44915]